MSTPIDTPLEILGGISAEVFLRDYWQKKPLLIRQAIPNFVSPLDGNDLAGLSLEELVESRIVLEHGETPGNYAKVLSLKTPTAACQNATGLY